MLNKIKESSTVLGAKKLAEWAKRNPWKSLGLALAFTAICIFGQLIVM